MKPSVTVLDLVDAYFHGDPVKDVSRLSRRDIYEFGQQVQQFYEASEPNAAPGGVYLGGWHSGAPIADPIVMQEMLKSLLYYESIVVHDPLAEYFREGTPRLPEIKPMWERRRQYSLTALVEGWATTGTYGAEHEDLSLLRSSLTAVLSQIETLRPAIQAGIVFPRSVWPIVEDRVHQLSSALRHDLKDPTMQATFSRLLASGEPPLSWDNLRGMSVIPDSGFFPGDEPLQAQAPFLYLAKSLAIADGTGARYAPFAAPDFELFAAKVEQSISRSTGFISGELIRSVANVAVPEFSLPIKDLVSIRKGEEAFESWRAEVRTLSNLYGHLSGEELEAAVSDAMQSKIAEVDQAVRKGSMLQKAKSGFSELALTGGLSAGISYASSGQASMAAGVAAPAVALWIAKMLQPSRPNVGAEVLTILRARSR